MTLTPLHQTVPDIRSQAISSGESPSACSSARQKCSVLFSSQECWSRYFILSLFLHPDAPKKCRCLPRVRARSRRRGRDLAGYACREMAALTRMKLVPAGTSSAAGVPCMQVVVMILGAAKALHVFAHSAAIHYDTYFNAVRDITPHALLRTPFTLYTP